MKTQKTWLSPLLAIAFAAVSLSGIIMLFHLRLPGLHAIHQWGGVLLLIGGILHLVYNGKLFLSYFRHRRALYGAAAGIVAIIVIALAVPPQQHDERGPASHSPHRFNSRSW